jgi:hypothetical protein
MAVIEFTDMEGAIKFAGQLAQRNPDLYQRFMDEPLGISGAWWHISDDGQRMPINDANVPLPEEMVRRLRIREQATKHFLTGPLGN